MRRSLVPTELRGQARACVEVAAQAALFFRVPSEAGAFAAREAGLAARRAGEAAASAIRSRADSRRSDWLGLSRFFAEAASQSAAAAAEAVRFGLRGAQLAPLAAGLRDAARELEAALGAFGDARACAELVVSAKRRLLEAERLGRGCRDASLDGPDAVLDLKTRTVLRRLGGGADAWQRAADRIVELVEVAA
ncbi:MAG: hypothetical protein PHF00_07505 [Elusimicrobia bacterium]|nr:hypothetical protein [Elusimicrobiota bacterium]